VEAIRSFFPQLDGVGTDPEPTPTGRADGCRFARESLGQLGHPPFEDGSALDHLALVTDDGAPA